MRNPARQRGRTGGFTLVELMVALALAAMISVAIMVISSQAQQVYQTTARKVEVYNKFRFALLSIERDFAQWTPTSNLEFFIDGKGAGARRNENWDPGEELPDPPGKPGTIDGGRLREFDEFAYVLERHYYGYEDKLNTIRKVHDAYQAYFRTMTFIDGRVREANVEYMLLDPNNLDAQGRPQPPTEVKFENMGDLSLYKIVRYHDMTYDEMNRATLNYPVVRKDIEVCTNITDFRIEYTVENRFDRKTGGVLFRTPKEDFDDPVEPVIAPKILPELTALPGGGFIKRFGYGSFKIQDKWPRAIAFRAIQGDRQMRTDHRPVRFGWEQNPQIRFAELVPGDKIFIFTEADRGGAGGGEIGVAGQLGALIKFPTGLYTVKTNLSGRLEFYEDIDSTTWQRDSAGSLYKAAFIPEAIRITLRVIDDTDTADRDAKTLQRAVWIRGKSR